MKVAPQIELSLKERKKLETIKRSRASSIRARERAAIVLLAAAGLENKEIALQLGQDKMKVGRWRHRYAQRGIEGILKDKSRPGRIPALPSSTKSRIISLTLKEKPEGATHWSRTSPRCILFSRLVIPGALATFGMSERSSDCVHVGTKAGSATRNCESPNAGIDTCDDF